jgi:hypothetical protein
MCIESDMGDNLSPVFLLPPMLISGKRPVRASFASLYFLFYSPSPIIIILLVGSVKEALDVQHARPNLTTTQVL